MVMTLIANAPVGGRLGWDLTDRAEVVQQRPDARGRQTPLLAAVSVEEPADRHGRELIDREVLVIHPTPEMSQSGQ
jgi:hypothetical protein